MAIKKDIYIDLSDHQGKDVGLQLKEMPLTEHTASELLRLYLEHNDSNLWSDKALAKNSKEKCNYISVKECPDVMVSR